MERAEQQGNKKVAGELADQLAVPPFPKALTYLWQAYAVLRGRKAHGFHGPNPIEWQDFESFLRLSGGHLAPWEIKLLIEIDDLFLTASATKPAQEGVVDSAPADDPDAVRRVMSAFGARRRGKRVIANG